MTIDRQQITDWMRRMYWIQLMPEEPGTELPITQTTPVMVVGWPGSDKAPPEDDTPLEPCPGLPAMPFRDAGKLLAGLKWGQQLSAWGYAGIVTDHGRLKGHTANDRQISLFGEAA